jgi:Cysteine-rich secretory protein family
MALWVGVLAGALIFCQTELKASSADSSAAQELFQLTNQEREKNGLQPLAWDDRLAKAAAEHAQLMAEHEELSHQFSGEPSVRDRIAATNLHFDRSGENVAYDDNPTDANRGLMNSPPHRANILSPDYNAIGIAAVQKGDLLYVVEDFARRLPDYTTDKVEQIIAAELAQVRARHSGYPLERVEDPALRAQACQMAQEDKLITSGLKTPKPARYIVSYTATDPSKLPSNTMAPILNPTTRSFSLGACYAKSASHPNALYWVALTFY